MLRELVDMLGPDGLRLAALDVFLYAIVAAFGPVRFCNTGLAAYFGWDPPPGPLVPALLKLRRLFLDHGSGAALAGSPSALFRADLHGPAALWLSTFMWLWAAAFLAALRVPFPLSLFGEGRSPFFHLGLVAALVLLPVALSLPARAVVRALLCAECLSGIGEPHDGGGQQNPCGQREKKKHCIEEIRRHFSERSDGPGFVTGSSCSSSDQHAQRLHAVRAGKEKVVGEQEGSRGGERGEKELCQILVQPFAASNAAMERMTVAPTPLAWARNSLALLREEGVSASSLVVNPVKKGTRK